ncbi:MAG: periplasmic component of the Tol biopolymer transport system [Planctomycetaceae bacterium]|nr:periplasmic component of the Tol biopolymer transport system [Planctomycetaceae bacterium]
MPGTLETPVTKKSQLSDRSEDSCLGWHRSWGSVTRTCKADGMYLYPIGSSAAAMVCFLGLTWNCLPVLSQNLPHLSKVTSGGEFKQRPAWSPDGRYVCFARYEGNTIQLWLKNLESQKERRLTNRDTPEYDASWAPDGKRLVFCAVAQSPGQGNLDLCTVGVEDLTSRHLIGDNGKLSHEESPAWSPDGKQIAFTSTRDGNQEIYVMDPSGQNIKRVTQDPGLDAHPTWTPDGKHLLFATNRWGDFEIAAIDPQGAQIQRLTNQKGLDDYPVCSPDGRSIAFVSLRSGNFEVYLMPREGGSPTNISNNPGIDNFPSWTSHGDLSWISNREGDFSLYVLGTK